MSTGVAAFTTTTVRWRGRGDRRDQRRPARPAGAAWTCRRPRSPAPRSGRPRRRRRPRRARPATASAITSAGVARARDVRDQARTMPDAGHRLLGAPAAGEHDGRLDDVARRSTCDDLGARPAGRGSPRRSRCPRRRARSANVCRRRRRLPAPDADDAELDRAAQRRGRRAERHARRPARRSRRRSRPASAASRQCCARARRPSAARQRDVHAGLAGLGVGDEAGAGRRPAGCAPRRRR